MPAVVNNKGFRGTFTDEYDYDYEHTPAWKKGTSAVAVTKYKAEPVTADTLKKNAEFTISKFLENNIILIEPEAWLKALKIQFVLPKLEVFTKCIIEEEGNYLCVKDLLIPDQLVTAATFGTEGPNGEDLLGRWLAELNKNPDGSWRDVEEVNYLTSHMLGHLHSHFSVSSNTSIPKPSPADDADVEKHRTGKPYWVEIIVNGYNMSGRISLEGPPALEIPAKVVLKWWSGIENIIAEMDGRIFERVIDNEPVKTKKKKIRKKSKNNNSLPPGNVEVNLDRIINEGKVGKERVFVSENIVKTFWDEYDPLLLRTNGLMNDDVQSLSQLMLSVIFDDEWLMWEFSPDEKVSLIVTDINEEFVEYFQSRLENMPTVDKAVRQILSSYGLVTGFSLSSIWYQQPDNQLVPLPRFIDYEKAVQFRHNLIAETVEEEIENTKIVKFMRGEEK